MIPTQQQIISPPQQEYKFHPSTTHNSRVVLGCFRRGLRHQRHGQSAEALCCFRLAVKDTSPMVATAAHNVRAAQFFCGNRQWYMFFVLGGEGGGNVRDTTTPHWKLFGCVISLVWHVWERSLYKNIQELFLLFLCLKLYSNCSKSWSHVVHLKRQGYGLQNKASVWQAFQSQNAANGLL